MTDPSWKHSSANEKVDGTTTAGISPPPPPVKSQAHQTLHNEYVKNGDQALELVEERIIVTDEDDRRICRRTDLHILSLCCWVYFLQILDKSVIGYSAVFGLKTNAHLVGNQYSTIGSIGYYAQLGAQPLGAYLLVKLPVRTIMPVIVFCWGCALCGMAGSTKFQSLAASRFLLGFFEAACLPLFSLITVSWYRRAEQPMRVAAWYSTNGIATILGSALVYGLGHIKSSVLHSYQIIFLVTGLITVITGPCLYFLLDNSVLSARFLTAEDRHKGVERLRSNNTGVVNTEFKWRQVIELALEPKTYLFLSMTLLVNVGASTSNVFGPLILQGLAGFDSYTTTLLNIPFGVLQFVVIITASYVATRTSIKSIVLAAFMVPVVIGAGLLYGLPHTKEHKGPLLLGYYMLSFLFSANPLIVSWIVGNTAGNSKKAGILCAYNAASSAGNIIGPYLFKATDAPSYLPGLKAILGIFCALLGVIGLQVIMLSILNKRKETQRVKNGKPAKLKDLSMVKKFDNSEQVNGVVISSYSSSSSSSPSSKPNSSSTTTTTHASSENDGKAHHHSQEHGHGQGEGEKLALGENAFLDMTDAENDEFVYIL